MTPEWLWNLSSLIPGLLVAWWVSWTAGWLWRRTVWQRIGVHARAMAGPDGVVPVWGGWRVQIESATVTWRGGLMGLRTTIKTASGSQRYSGLLDETGARGASSSDTTG